jgi:hypothetical protein
MATDKWRIRELEAKVSELTTAVKDLQRIVDSLKLQMALNQQSGPV